jgi:hypothetical protein
MISINDLANEIVSEASEAAAVADAERRLADPGWYWRSLNTATHRYWLERDWEFLVNPRRLAWCMLNGSTATDEQDDPTVRRTIGFSKRDSYGGEVIVNLWTLRGTDPRCLRSYEPSARELELADECILQAADCCADIVVAWGCHGALRGRGEHVIEVLRSTGREPLTLGLTRGCHPKHPLRIAANTQLVRLSEARRPSA